MTTARASDLSTLWATVRRLPPRTYQTVADQAVSSVGNFLFVAVVARTATAQEFGAFSLTYALYAIALGAGRAIGGEILLLRAVQRPDEARAESERLLFLVVALGGAAGACVFPITLLLDEALRETTRALAICLPILLLQDAIRYCFFVRDEPKRAVLNDSVWTLGQLLFFAAILVLSPDPAAAGLILGWAGGAALAVLVGLIQTGLIPRASAHVSRESIDRTRVRSFLVDYVLSAASFNAGFYAIAGVAGLAAAGAVRGAILLFAPLTALISALRIVVLPALARAALDGIGAMRRRAEEITAGLAVLALVYGLVVILLPDAVGSLILGDTWDDAEPLLLAIAVMYSTWAIGGSALAGLRALGGGRILVHVRAVSAALYLACVLIGAVMWEAAGAAAGMALAFATEAALWWIGLLRRRRGPERHRQWMADT